MIRKTDFGNCYKSIKKKKTTKKLKSGILNTVSNLLEILSKKLSRIIVVLFALLHCSDFYKNQ